MKYKYHAVFYVDEHRIKCFDDWEVAKEQMRGRPHLNKGFNTKEELTSWLKGITANDVARARREWGKK